MKTINTKTHFNAMYTLDEYEHDTFYRMTLYYRTYSGETISDHEQICVIYDDGICDVCISMDKYTTVLTAKIMEKICNKYATFSYGIGTEWWQCSVNLPSFQSFYDELRADILSLIEEYTIV